MTEEETSLGKTALGSNGTSMYTRDKDSRDDDLASKAKRNITEGSPFEVCKSLVRDLEPEYCRRYLSGGNSSETREQTRLVQDLILSMLRRGPIRKSVHEIAARRAHPDISQSSEVTHNTDGYEPDISTAEEINALFSVTCELFTLANDDNCFTFLCLLFDKDIERKFSVYAGVFLAFFRQKNSPQLPVLMKDVIEHAETKLNGVKDSSDYQRRETTLFGISELLAKAREAFGLLPYSKIKSRFS